MARNRKKEEDEFIPKAFKKDKKIKEEPKRKRRKKDKKKITIKKVILIVILVLILIVGISLGISAHTWKTLAKDMLTNENSIVVDTDNNKIATLGTSKNKEYISLSAMPDNLKNAYVAIEDERYYNHGGIDIKRTASAIFSYVINFGSSSYGGSTITQQLVKNLTGDSTDSITRKVREWWKACILETGVSKDEILEGYLNIIYVGPNVYGVEAGAKYYFNKSATNLSLAECAFLAGINNSPNSYNPFVDTDNTEKITKRTITVLAKMQELGYINEEQYNEAKGEVEKGLTFQKGTFAESTEVYSYHTDALIPEVTTAIAEKYNISETFATNYIEMAGLTIYSTQDSEVQKEMETESNKSKYILASKTNSGETSQAAMVIIDHTTGEVRGCTGGLGKKTESRTFNRATQSVRQTGSAIKPIAVLLPALDKKIITAATMVDDTEQDFENGYHPTDYSKSLGNVTVRRAVESSQNIPFVEIMEDLKPNNSINYLEKMGVTSLTEKDNSLPLALGGLDKGISPLEMAAAYSTIANDGKYIEPTFFSKIDKKNGTELLKTKQDTRNVVSKEVAYILKELLTQPVLGSSGTATYCKISGVDVAAKTGTTDENYDRWLCGFTPYYTAVTWYGYDQNETVNFNKKNPAGLIWANVMSRIHTGLKSATFEKPTFVQSAIICPETGMKATTGCSNTYTEYFLWFTMPGTCDKHSGSELTENETNITENTINDVIQGITNEIDAVDPQEVLREEKENESTNAPTVTPESPSTNTINTINTTNTNSNTNTSTTNNTTTNTSTNTSTNSTNSSTSNTINTTQTNTTNTSREEIEEDEE